MRSLSSLLLVFFLILSAALAAPAAVSPLFLQGPVSVPAGWMLPSPGLRKVLYAPSCAPGNSVLSILDLGPGNGAPPTGEARPVAGRIEAVAWVDDQSYLLLRGDQAASHLELIDAATGHAQLIDKYPAAPPASWSPGKNSGPCGPAEVRYGLWTGGTEVAVAVRRSETSFDVLRYTRAQGPLPLVRRATQYLGAHRGPPRQRLWQVLPVLTGDQVVLLWRDQVGLEPAVTIDLATPLPTGSALRTLGRAAGDLDTCQLAGAGVLVCHSAPDAAHGRLWTLDTRSTGDLQPQQLTAEGSALAYGLSPDGRLLGYVGGKDGPLVVQDLQSGARWQATLPTLALDLAGTQPAVYLSSDWAGDGALHQGLGQVLSLGRGGDALLWSTSAPVPTVATTPTPGMTSASTSTPGPTPAPTPRRRSSATHRAGRSSSGYWTPQY